MIIQTLLWIPDQESRVPVKVKWRSKQIRIKEKNSKVLKFQQFSSFARPEELTYTDSKETKKYEIYVKQCNQVWISISYTVLDPEQKLKVDPYPIHWNYYILTIILNTLHDNTQYL